MRQIVKVYLFIFLRFTTIIGIVFLLLNLYRLNTVRFAAAGYGLSRVKVVSKPIFAFASVDFGKNKMNVNLIARILGM